DDEGQDENLRRLPNNGRRANLRPHPLRHIHRAKAGLEHPPNPHRKPSRPHPRPRRLTDGLGVTARASREFLAAEQGISREFGSESRESLAGLVGAAADPRGRAPWGLFSAANERSDKANLPDLQIPQLQRGGRSNKRLRSWLAGA